MLMSARSRKLTGKRRSKSVSAGFVLVHTDVSSQAHPDKGGSEAAMAAVNEAYEVLSNPELRARFDRG